MLGIKMPENISKKRRENVPRLPKYMKTNPHIKEAAFGRLPPLWIPLWGLVFMYLVSLGTLFLHFWEELSGSLISSILI